MNQQKPRVLIAEDNPGLAKVLTFKFKASNFDVVCCADGESAWNAFCHSEFDAVITDHEMPAIPGVELIRRIKKTHPELPCFLVTGRQLELARDPAVLRLEFDHVFAKPFSPREVIAAVEKSLLECDRSQGESRSSTPILSVTPVAASTNASAMSSNAGVVG